MITPGAVGGLLGGGHQALTIDFTAAMSTHPASAGTAQQITTLFAEAQSAKAFLGTAAVRIVDRALALAGGAGSLNGSPLARAYRDVRATAFMHPLAANRAYPFLGQFAAGREPSLH